MKDTILTARRKKIEFITMLVCFLIGNLLNLYAIIIHKANYSELYSSIFYVITFSVVLYLLWSVIRFLLYGIISLFIKKREK